MRSIWNGAISFGLVSIPIKLLPATNPRALSFQLLHDTDNARILYKKVCSKDGQEVPPQEIARGIEVRKGVYYKLSEEELKKLRPEKTNSIDIIEFVDSPQVDSIYFSNHYFAVPDMEKEKAYFLFKEVLQITGKIAIGKFVLRSKEYVCSIKAYKEGLLLSTLNYAYEIRDIGEVVELKSVPKLIPEEIDLAEQLIDRIYKKEFDITKFKDSFAEDVKEIVKKKEAGEEVIVAEQEKVFKEEDIIKALKASLKN